MVPHRQCVTLSVHCCISATGTLQICYSVRLRKLLVHFYVVCLFNHDNQIQGSLTCSASCMALKKVCAR